MVNTGKNTMELTAAAAARGEMEKKKERDQCDVFFSETPGFAGVRPKVKRHI
jgi:hypothetical protein